jgi:hypothetical protein
MELTAGDMRNRLLIATLAVGPLVHPALAAGDMLLRLRNHTDLRSASAPKQQRMQVS